MLRHVDLRRRDGHESGDSERPSSTPQSVREYRCEKKKQKVEEQRDPAQRLQRFGSKQAMPEIASKNIQEPNRRENGAGKFFLYGDVPFNNSRVASQTNMREAIYIFAIEAFVESNARKHRLRMNFAQRAERTALESLWREPQKYRKCEYQTESADKESGMLEVLDKDHVASFPMH